MHTCMYVCLAVTSIFPQVQSDQLVVELHACTLGAEWMHGIRRAQKTLTIAVLITYLCKNIAWNIAWIKN